jgi:SAM-dependent methyltransferase
MREPWEGPLGRRWAERPDAMDATFDRYGLAAIERLDPRPGEKVLDVGCGCGATSLELGRRVAPGGQVRGIDISSDLVDRARQRIGAAALDADVRVDVADASAVPLDGSYDALFSRFGVMFFEEPVDAFSHLRTGLRPGGRLAFVCWQARDQNPWMTVPMMAAAAVMDVPPPPGPREPGGAAFAEPEYVRDILDRSGFTDLGVSPFTTEAPLPGGRDARDVIDTLFAVFPPLFAAAGRADADTVARATDAIVAAIEPYRRDDGYYLPGSAWIVTAVNPG